MGEGEVEEVEEREDKGWKREVWSEGGGGDGVEMALVGTVDKLPDVVKGDKSKTSGKWTFIEFLDAKCPKCIDRLRCKARTGGG